MKRGTITLVVLLFVASVMPIQAAEGRIPIFEPVVFDGNLSSISGKYVVTRDITSTGTGPPIVFIGTGAEEVDIDLNGFTVTGGSASTLVISVTELGRFTCRNGSLRAVFTDFDQNALRVFGSGTAHRVIIEDINATGGGILVAGATTFALRRNIIDTSKYAIRISPSTLANATGTIEDNISLGATIGAIFIDALGAGILPMQGVRVVNNQADSGIIWADTVDGLLLEGNSLNGGRGVSINNCTGCRVLNNAVNNNQTSPLGFGFRFFDTNHCLVEGNVASGNLDDGIMLSGSTNIHLVGNVSSGNSDFGIRLLSSTDNHLERNVTNGNGDFGILIDATSLRNRVGKNSASGNLGAGSCVGGAGTATCGIPAYCNRGGAFSFGDNLFPGPGPC